MAICCQFTFKRTGECCQIPLQLSSFLIDGLVSCKQVKERGLSNCQQTKEEKQACAFVVEASSNVKFVNNEEADPAANLNLSEVCIFSGAW